MKLYTLIGSFPHKEPKEVLELLLKYSKNLALCWPQLPKRSFKEHMCPQYSENFPGIIVDEQNEKILLDEEKFYTDLEKFYQNYIDKNLQFFKISQDYAAGFYEFISQLSNSNSQFSIIKLQSTGPITFGLTVKTSQGQPIFYNEQIRDTIVKNIVMKSIWQIKQVLSTLRSTLNAIILFLDEPYLAAYGSAFTAVSREEIVTCLNETIKEIKNFFLTLPHPNSLTLKIGVHCCANTDWSILTDLYGLDIISFDTYGFFNDFILYSENIKNFISNGILAWGIVPNNEEIIKVDTQKLFNLLQNCIIQLANKGVDKEKLLKNLIITPQCGLGNTTVDVSEQVLRTCNELVEFIT